MSSRSSASKPSAISTAARARSGPGQAPPVDSASSSKSLSSAPSASSRSASRTRRTVAPTIGRRALACSGVQWRSCSMRPLHVLPPLQPRCHGVRSCAPNVGPDEPYSRCCAAAARAPAASDSARSARTDRRRRYRASTSSAARRHCRRRRRRGPCPRPGRRASATTARPRAARCRSARGWTGLPHRQGRRRGSRHAARESGGRRATRRGARRRVCCELARWMSDWIHGRNHRSSFDGEYTIFTTVYTRTTVMDSTTTDQPAPGELALVQRFVNTADLEHGTDRLRDAEGLAGWLAEVGLAGGRTRSTPPTASAWSPSARRCARCSSPTTATPADRDAVAALGRAAREAPIVVLRRRGARGSLRPRSGVDGALACAARDRRPRAGRGHLVAPEGVPDRACRWAFYDRSRNRSRTWCAMSVCGNRAKARSYRARHR